MVSSFAHGEKGYQMPILPIARRYREVIKVMGMMVEQMTMLSPLIFKSCICALLRRGNSTITLVPERGSYRLFDPSVSGGDQQSSLHLTQRGVVFWSFSSATSSAC